jgi:hypothetical protein
MTIALGFNGRGIALATSMGKHVAARLVDAKAEFPYPVTADAADTAASACSASMWRAAWPGTACSTGWLERRFQAFPGAPGNKQPEERLPALVEMSFPQRSRSGNSTTLRFGPRLQGLP